MNDRIVSTIVPDPGAAGVVNVSLNGIDWAASPSMPSGWQEYREKDSGNPSGFLDYSDDTASAYKIEVVDSGTGRDDGYTTGDDSGVMPDNVLSRCLAHAVQNTYKGIKFTGLNNSLTYQLEITGSIDATWGWTQTYKVGGTEKSLSADENTSLSVIFTGVSPSSGEILIEFKGSNAWTIINGVILTEE